MGLNVGSVCRRGHRISRVEDLKVWIRKEGGHTTTCRQCMSYLKANPAERRRYNKLEIGKKCSRGHKIMARSDLYLKSKKSDGTEYYACAKCTAYYMSGWRQQERQRDKSAHGNKRDTRRFIVLTCGHEIIFNSPCPRRGEPVWCERCEYFDSVREWGELAPRPAPGVLALATGREQSPVCEQDGDDPGVHTLED